VENTFTCIEDMAGKMLPPLALLLGAGKPLNFIVTNRWRNHLEIARVTRLPLLMIVSMRVGGWEGAASRAVRPRLLHVWIAGPGAAPCRRPFDA
jgi:hypothetical protein